MADTTILSLTEAQAFLSIDGTAPARDGLQSLINAVARVVENRVGPIDPATYTRVLCGEGDEALAFPHRNILTVVSCAYVETGSDPGLDLSSGNLVIDTRSGVVYLKSGRWPDEELLVTYTVGLASVPANVKEAAKIILQNAYAAKRGPGRPGPGSQEPTTAFLIPYRAEALLAPDVVPLGFA